MYVARECSVCNQTSKYIKQMKSVTSERKIGMKQSPYDYS